ncbi:MAG: HEAT repeat domain-containing protein [Elusimicrobia bacterium]|nr:HEAT repeat domain-containing protein [Elusimicrobiota bacterium]
MKFLLMTVVLCVAGYFAWQQFKPKPLPPPPPPPPAILTEPAPLITPEEQTKIIKSANDTNPEVRWQAILFLDKMRVPAFFDVVFERMQKDQDLEVRLKIITLLGQRGSDKRIAEISQHLVAATKDSVPEVRMAALQALDALGDYSVGSVVTDSLKDGDERVRLQALKTLNNLQEKKAAMIEAERKRQEELRLKAEEAAKNK